MRISQLRFVAFLGLVGVGLAPGLLAQNDAESRIRALEEQNKSIIEQNRVILDRLAATERRNAELEERLANSGSTALETRLDELIGNLGDAARGDVVTNPSLTRSASPIQFSGRIRTDAYYNTARMNSAINPMWVQPENNVNAIPNDDQFAIDARLTTIGIDIDAGSIGAADVGGRVQFDFANFNSQNAESRAYPRVLVAFVNIDFGRFTIRAGQDWDIVAPFDPLVDEQSHLWNAGNLGDRRPMIEFLYQGGDTSGFAYEVHLGAGLTGAVDNDDLDQFTGQFLTTERDGFDTGHPHGQAAIEVSFPSWVQAKRVRIGVSGLLGDLQTDSDVVRQSNFEIWAGSVHFIIPVITDVQIKGEGFIGQALADFRGGIAQSIDPTSGREIKSIGGWSEVFWQVTELFGFGLGASIDSPDFSDLGDGFRASNWTTYLATRFDWGNGLTTGFDAMFWKTEYKNREEGDTLRFDIWVQLTF